MNGEGNMCTVFVLHSEISPVSWDRTVNANDVFHGISWQLKLGNEINRIPWQLKWDLMIVAFHGDFTVFLPSANTDGFDGISMNFKVQIW